MGARFAAAISAGFLAASSGCSLFVSLDGLSDDDAGQSSSDASLDGNANDAASDAATSSDADASSSAYASAVLADSPLAYFHLDETTGTTLADSSGHGHDATSSTVLLGQSGAFAGSGTAVHFDGNALIAIPGTVSDAGTPFDFTGTSPFSFEAWVKIDFQLDGGDTAFTFLSKEQDLGSGKYHGVDFFDDPVIQLQREDDPIESTQASATNPLPDTSWHYLVGTYDGSTISIYVDNAIVGSQTGSSTMVPVTSVPFLIGAEDVDGDSALVGSMDEVAIYTTALTTTQRAAHFHAAGK
jgi:hypothetical protein